MVRQDNNGDDRHMRLNKFMPVQTSLFVHHQMGAYVLFNNVEFSDN